MLLINVCLYIMSCQNKGPISIEYIAAAKIRKGTASRDFLPQFVLLKRLYLSPFKNRLKWFRAMFRFYEDIDCKVRKLRVRVVNDSRTLNFIFSSFAIFQLLRLGMKAHPSARTLFRLTVPGKSVGSFQSLPSLST